MQFGSSNSLLPNHCKPYRRRAREGRRPDAQRVLLKKHFYFVNENKRNIKCTLCGRAFPDQSHLKSHFKNVHQKTERKFKCNLCEKSFKHKHILEGHIALIHEEKKKYNCASCPEVFDRIGSLRDHFETVHVERSIWLKTFSFSHYFQTCIDSIFRFHFKMLPTTSKQLSDLLKEEKEFKCDFCDKIFEKNWILNLHMRTHEEKCETTSDICDKVPHLKTFEVNQWK